MVRRFFYCISFYNFFFRNDADAQPLPRSVAIGSNPPGSLFYSLASGLAKVVSEASPMQAQVQPYAGTSTFVPLFESGELDRRRQRGRYGNGVSGPETQGRRKKSFSSRTQLTAALARFAAPQQPDRAQGFADQNHCRCQRQARHRRYPAQLAVWYNVFGSLSNAGLTWNDVKVWRCRRLTKAWTHSFRAAPMSPPTRSGPQRSRRLTPRSAFATFRLTALNRARRASRKPCRDITSRS